MVLVLLLAGCPWISDAELDAQLGKVDDDGDGAPNRVDCAPTDPSAYPGAEEVWYDGVDQACDGGDDDDQDGDGHAFDGRGGDDCDDLDPAVHPGAEDAAYDGVDADCGGDDDYDRDGDGFVSDAHVGLATVGVPGSGALPGGDCDDARADVSPGATEQWYDGVDADCGGEDDYDQDGDGYHPDDVAYGPTTYVDGSGGLPGGDCDDTTAERSPGVVEVWYDGVDGDCSGDADDDQDADGATVDEDCDDTDPARAPGRVEALGDAVDADCDGGADSFVIAALGGTWTGATGPAFAHDGANLFLSVGVEVAVWEGEDWYAGGLAVGWASGGLGAAPSLVEAWSAAPTDPGVRLTPPHAVLASGGALWGVVGATDGDTRSLRVVRWGSGVRPTAATAQSGSGRQPFVDGGLVVEGGVAWAAGCDGADVLTYARVDDIFGGSATVQDEVAGVPAHACAPGLGELPAIYVGAGSEVSAFRFDPYADDPGLLPSSLYAPLDVADLDVPPEDPSQRVVLADRSTGYAWRYDPVSTALETFALGGAEALATWSDPTGALWVAQVDASGRVGFGYGSTPEGLSTTTLTTTLRVEDVAVWSGEGWVAVAVTGPDGVGVGWAETP